MRDSQVNRERLKGLVEGAFRDVLESGTSEGAKKGWMLRVKHGLENATAPGSRRQVGRDLENRSRKQAGRKKKYNLPGIRKNLHPRRTASGKRIPQTWNFGPGGNAKPEDYGFVKG